jgi:hypothetical protein
VDEERMPTRGGKKRTTSARRPARGSAPGWRLLATRGRAADVYQSRRAAGTRTAAACCGANRSARTTASIRRGAALETGLALRRILRASLIRRATRVAGRPAGASKDGDGKRRQTKNDCSKTGGVARPSGDCHLRSSVRSCYGCLPGARIPPSMIDARQRARRAPRLRVGCRACLRVD